MNKHFISNFLEMPDRIMRHFNPKKNRISDKKTINALLISFCVVILITGCILLIIEPIKRHNRRKIASDAYDAISGKMEASEEMVFVVPVTGNEVPGEEYDYIVDETEETVTGDTVELGAVGLLKIDSLDISYSVWGETTQVSLRYGLGHYPGSVMPGDIGNAAILGHNYKDGTMFHRLGELGTGDEVVFIGADGIRRVFYVEESKIISADVLLDYVRGDITEDRQLTLVTCTYEYGSKGWRRVVICKMAE